MNIIRSAVVDPATDTFWDDITDYVTAATPKPILILSASFDAGSNQEIKLNKMLTASGLKQDNYIIVQTLPGQKISWHQLREIVDPKAVLLIGVLPAQLGISALFQVNVPNNFNDRYWLPTLDLTQLEQQPEAKKQLWQNGLKPLFVDKTHGDLLA